MNDTGNEPIRRALIIGGSPAGLQAALDLADSGIEVHLVDSSPFLNHGEPGSMLERGLNTRWLEATRHPNIHIWTKTKVTPQGGDVGHFHISINQAPRYVDITRCIACGDCIEACPVNVWVTEPTAGISHKAIYIDGQPGCAAIEKRGMAPCRAHCPINQRAQGYIALIRQGRYADAYRTIKTENPFPSVCGRVCNHRCEDACSRGRYDEPVNIMALKRFVADWAFAHQDQVVYQRGGPAVHPAPPTGKRVAIIGAGPAGLTAGLDLVRLGHSVTVFDSLPTAGGMMRVGIPPHRLPTELLDWEVQQIVEEGVELRLNTWVSDIPSLFDQGYQAVLIATGAHVARKLRIPNADHPDNLLSLDILRNARLSSAPGTDSQSPPQLDMTGKKVVVLGGGNVALDTARTVLRLSADQVCMACLEPRGEMPGFAWEVTVAEEEGIQMYPGRTFKEIVVQNEKIVGVRCVEIEFRGFKDGRPDITEIPDSEHILPADVVVWAIGQVPNLSFLPQDGSISTNRPAGLQSDEKMMTTMDGVFVAGDVRRGVTFFVVDAIAEGHIVAQSIDYYLHGGQDWKAPQTPSCVTLTPEEMEVKINSGQASISHRIPISSIPLQERIHNFREVDLTLTEVEARAESERCMGCGVCSECLACVYACKAGAINHDQTETLTELDVGAIIEAGDPSTTQISLPYGRGIYHASPQDALLGSVAAVRVMADLGAREMVQLPVRAITPCDDKPTRIGVFVCQCGGEISRVVDTDAVARRAAAWPDVAYTQVLPFSCSPEAAATIGAAIDMHGLNRVVLAACSCCAYDQVCDSCTYQRVRCKNNLGVFPKSIQNHASASDKARFEFVNIREQCAWPHADDPQAATAKAIAFIAAAVAKSRLTTYVLQEQPTVHVGIDQHEAANHYSALILGSGAAGHVCTEVLHKTGISALHLESDVKRVRHLSGDYLVVENVAGGNEDRLWQAKAIVLAPKDAVEAHHLLSTFGKAELQPRLHNKWGGVETHRPGVYFCDFSGAAELVGAATAARTIAWLGRLETRMEASTVFVDPVYCRACGTCVDLCEFGAVQLIGEPPRISAWIDPTICAGCGVCAAHCPSGAIRTTYSTDVHLEAILAAVLDRP